ncbi:MAG TPA: SsrA-binding protein SmpB [Halanaerobiaceae bacterium]|jgi:SsrA-binding protein|nr:SsrA-binding protein SmpB [Bacillota bacterium]HHU92371.1 SsrA-binding protein SmpB [Halanaerobiaceae bacterium]HOA39891.1 SsrA-binding protein SmpB [Halanaerobiales bacterium]HPZ61966.1 SsrA-binding protein SmpB [Halanaerobiales bacterium]HQD03311.1 SsrA-binding protein SmpB [Halanaerobiales bacterium]
MAKDEIRVIARNKKARHDYHIEETFEAGIILKGTEIKSIRAGKVNLKDSFALVEDGEVFLYNMHISPYSHGNRENHEPERKRKLLLNKREIRKLIGRTTMKGYTLVPLSIYIKRNLAKIELALARGKKVWDKRSDIAQKTAEREIERAFKDRQFS